LRSWLCTCLTQLLRVARLRGVCISICAGAGGDPMKFLFFTIIGPNNNAVQVGSSRSAALGRGGPLAIVAPKGMQMWIVSRSVRFKGGIFQGSIISREPVDGGVFFLRIFLPHKIFVMLLVWYGVKALPSFQPIGDASDCLVCQA
jgi:hypothetical protein